MAGTLGKADLQPNVNTVLYTSPTNGVATLTLNICNRGGNETFVYVAISDTDTPQGSDYIEFNVVIPPFGVIERTGIVLGEGNKLVVLSETNEVSAVAYGFEDEL